MSLKLSEKIKSFPKKPGVYWMKGANDEVLYVGKAKNLKNRVRAYFQRESKQRFPRPVGRGPSVRSGQVDFLMKRTVDIEFLVTDTEKEALLLENTLIKKHQPRYNVFFKDDKSYASLKLTTQHPYPGVYVTRNVVKDGAHYYGPYASAGALRQTVDLLTKHFRLRTCSDHEFANRSRPCLEYQIGRCSAPCVGKVSQEDYETQMEEAKLFLEGKGKELIQKLRERMEKASEAESYEEAARHRDLIFYIKETLEKQKVIHHEGTDYDAIGYAKTTQYILICVLMIRKGVLLDRQKFLFPKTVEKGGEFLTHFLLQHYGTILKIPPMVLLPERIDDQSVVADILGERSEQKMELALPQRGEKKKMVALAVQNASSLATSKSRNEEHVLHLLQKKLGLTQLPHRIECVDISNLQGKEAVGSLVCFEEGRALKSRYRKFKIRFTQEEPNDYAMMYEVLSRRFRRVITAANPEEREKWSPPDLLLVDGGKGHLAVAVKALVDLGMHGLEIAAIAKGKGAESVDKVYIPGRKNQIAFRQNSTELLYLMRIRDEAHRFGLTYHRQLRAKKLVGVSKF